METQFYSLEEISVNNGVNEAKVWIVIKDIVYDVTDYMEEHPGGSELVKEWAGKNATKAFEEFGHSGDAKRELKKRKIGELREEDRKKQQKKGPKVVEAPEKKTSGRSLTKTITCGLCG